MTGGDATRDVALVLSGGSINGVMMELGFLQRMRESDLWPRLGWIFGTSAGALAGTMAALDRLDDLEAFLLELQGPDAFRPNKLWRLPLLGSHEYALPETIDERLGGTLVLAEALARSPVELVVCATDVTDTTGGDDPHDYELVYSSRSTEPAELAEAILATAAISTLVMPLRVGDRIVTDGGWLRNYPLAHAYHRPGVGLIVGFRYLPRYAPVDVTPLATIRRRLGRFSRVPPVKALIEELKEAEAREARGEPAHLLDMITQADADRRPARIGARGAGRGREGRRDSRALAAAGGGRRRDPPRRRRPARPRAGCGCGGRGLRRRRVPLRARPPRPADHRARLCGRGLARAALADAAALDGAGEAGADRPRLGAHGRGAASPQGY